MPLTGPSTKDCKVNIKIWQTNYHSTQRYLRDRALSASCKSNLEVVGKHIIKYKKKVNRASIQLGVNTEGNFWHKG